MIAPDQRAFEAHVARPTFRLGEAEGRWRLVEIRWPHAFIGVTAKDGREVILRLDCTGFPQALPTGGPWDMANDRVLAFDLWPRGQGRPSVGGFPHRLEERHRAVLALRPRKLRRSRKLAQ